MATTTTHRRDRQSSGPAAYLCWSHDNNRMEMTDLPGYLDSLQRSYASLQQAYSSMAGGVTPAAPSWGVPATGDRPRGRRHRHGEGRDRNHDRDSCGCGECERDCGCQDRRPDCGGGCGSSVSCRCRCCIEDADIVVYAHCGEVRVVPIEIENDTRKPRVDVSLDISDVRTAGGRVLPWSTATTVQGPLVLDACSTTRFEILVRVNCEPSDRAGGQAAEGGSDPAADKAEGTKVVAGGRASGRIGSTEAPATPATTGSRATKDVTDVDECVVGYFTVRLGGCLTRPIVVAIAALPYSCDSYRTGCACASCC